MVIVCCFLLGTRRFKSLVVCVLRNLGCCFGVVYCGWVIFDCVASLLGWCHFDLLKFIYVVIFSFCSFGLYWYYFCCCE